VDHPVEYEPLQPWRTAAMIATAIAAIELFILLLIGFLVGAKAFSTRPRRPRSPRSSAQSRRLRRPRPSTKPADARKQEGKPAGPPAGAPPSSS
jgi:hypothetical protein